jgi:hypothetical protein
MHNIHDIKSTCNQNTRFKVINQHKNDMCHV